MASADKLKGIADDVTRLSEQQQCGMLKLQDISNQVDQLAAALSPRTRPINSSANNLDDEGPGFEGIFFSLANLERLLVPGTPISTFILQRRKVSPFDFIMKTIQQHRTALRMPLQNLDEEILSLEACVNENFNEFSKSIRPIQSVKGVPSVGDSLPIILAGLEQMNFDLGPIDYWAFEKIDFAIILGYYTGAAGYYAHPDFARTEAQLRQLGTGMIRGTCLIRELEEQIGQGESLETLQSTLISTESDKSRK
ncbi:hypothetical protein FOPG_16387 [Fusarium oxysporum f. sp. conglutinans race 2 54008]|uniref:Uncharacterized protein n=3 Tax=Fusarium oxysporum f. sp. conglutinans TaxID=100902 RepID=A0A8H6LDG1_FUSOX|nr:hypothetical protein FOXB_17067 [Fusarium oxysporum f. sp. conglutinans Fo5176]EXL67493.1 hypothetical protein FOPG_16387 [Fusarium oxysporum f. sp. conglutinans race 2 54008]KAF6516124.1 hypothetical protein HZS61_004865 [Fusarium oxysporum f. sp. conglutinans]KAG6979703.1 hypothetical protein FocnCong_v010003 [Fusarium oxysporum f. sp. conglutinans]KAI8402624.1 hypothetical protein FOFC_17940 [Fusarium oxysporum]